MERKQEWLGGGVGRGQGWAMQHLLDWAKRVRTHPERRGKPLVSCLHACSVLRGRWDLAGKGEKHEQQWGGHTIAQKRDDGWYRGLTGLEKQVHVCERGKGCKRPR